MKYTGEELVEAFRTGANWWVGRSGGIRGTLFRRDVETGQWRERTYEVNTAATKPPSSNFFELRSFIDSVGDEKSEIRKNVSTGSINVAGRTAPHGAESENKQ